MEIYVGAYLAIPRERKNKEVFYYVCPTDVTHHNTSYENAKFCSTCGKKIEKRTEIVDGFVENQKIALINDTKIRVPMYFSTNSDTHDYWVAYRTDDGQVYFNEASDDDWYIPKAQITMEELVKSRQFFFDEYQTFIEFLNDNQIKYTLEVGVLIN